MSAAKGDNEIAPLIPHFQPILNKLSDEMFFEFCRANDQWRIERTAEGDITIIAPTGGKTGIRDSKLIVQLVVWNEREDRGQIFDSSTIFVLPNSAQLGWLIDPVKRRVHVYRPDVAVKVIDDPLSISGGDLLQGFILDVASLWS